jgi:LPPG:FO 2-phospho-L-lactate transferase
MTARHYVALCGGVGGAKLALGLTQVLPADSLIVAVNIGDDFEHLGLTICPDLDTVMYTLAGIVHSQQGWGRSDETWGVLDELKRLVAPTWFLLGDRDVALHLVRRQLLDQGCTLSQVSAELAKRLGIRVTVAPVSDQPVRTILNTDGGRLGFQDYFVRLRCEPRISSIDFMGATEAGLSPLVRDSLNSPALAGVILCPSNPYLSIAPMLAIPGLRECLRTLTVPVVAVAPIVAGAAIKGPTAKIMRELGVEPSAAVVAQLYEDFVDAVIVDTADAALARTDARFLVAPTVMNTLEQKAALATQCLTIVERLSAR